MGKTIYYTNSALIALLGVVFFLFITPPAVSAQEFSFNDEFNQERSPGALDTNLWTINENIRCGTHTFHETGGSVKFFQCKGLQFPYIISKSNPFTDADFSAEISFQYTKVTHWGTGFALAPKAPPNGEAYDSLPNISVWQDKSRNNMRVTYRGTDVYTQPVNTDSHIFKVNRKSKKYYIYFDNNLVFTSPDNAEEVKNFWMGNPTFMPTGTDWTEFKVDYIRVSKTSTLLPVIFIPGLGGSELKANQDIIWSKDDGHGGVYSHAYPSGEKVWVNQDEAIKLGDDDYFDVLRLKPDGESSEADLALTGELTSYGYPDIDNFFQGLGYTKGTNYFVYPYDWRKDIKTTEQGLDNLINTAIQNSGQSKVNIVAHSMGGLVARYYITDSTKANKVNKLIELGVPHLGSVNALKAVMYGQALTYNLYFLKIPIIPASEIKDVLENLVSAFELIPNTNYYSFYDNSSADLPYPFSDQRDIDSNGEIGDLHLNQLMTLMTNILINLIPFNLAQQFQDFLISYFDKTSEVKLYSIVGTGQPTLGQIRETWLVKWPINLIPNRDEIYINGDGTVPLYSASLRSLSLDLSSNSSIYYTAEKHSELVDLNSNSMQIVKAILAESDGALVAGQKTKLKGKQITTDEGELDLNDDEGNHTGLNDKGEVETNIPGTSYSGIGKNKNIFITDKAPKVKVKLTSPQSSTTNIKIRDYKEDKVNTTITYRDVPINNTNNTLITVDPGNSPPTLTVNDEPVTPTSEASGSAALDQTPPETKIEIKGDLGSSGNYIGPVTISLTGNDTESGILKIEYSLDNGQTVQTYIEPFTISTPGTTTIQFRTIDNLGNEEIPQSLTITINQPVSIIATTVNSQTNTNLSNNNTNNPTATNSSNNISSSNSPSNNDLFNSLLTQTQQEISDNIHGVQGFVAKFIDNPSRDNQHTQLTEVLGAKAVNPVTQLDINNPNDRLRMLMIPVIVEGVLLMLLVITFMKKAQ